MNMSLSAPLPQSGALPQKTEADYPQKFEDIAPGSRVRVVDRDAPTEPFDATVLETMPEYGPASIPAMTIAIDGVDGPVIITSSGKFAVTVLVDSSKLPSQAPKDAVRVQLVPVKGQAVQFKGGQVSASQIVRWLIGKAAPQYKQPTDTEPDRLEFAGRGIARPGDWIVRHDDGDVRLIAENQFSRIYEETI